jgi:hypothetical protein
MIATTNCNFGCAMFFVQATLFNRMPDSKVLRKRTQGVAASRSKAREQKTNLGNLTVDMVQCAFRVLLFTLVYAVACATLASNSSSSSSRASNFELSPPSTLYIKTPHFKNQPEEPA